jgi:predicted RND superfamily exporter protein/lauroyl/myristoyl acyltransferase
LRFDVEILNLLPADSPVVQGLQLYQDRFANTRELIITLETDDEESAESAARSLAEVLRDAPDLVQAVTWQSPGRDDPQAAAEFVAYLWLNQPSAGVEALIQRLQPDAVRTSLLTAREELATAFSPDSIARLSYDPLSLASVPGWSPPLGPNANDRSLFASDDGKFRALFVQGPDSLSNYRAFAQWFARVRRLATDWRTQWVTEVGKGSPLSPRPQLDLRFTGQPAFMAEIGGGMEADLVRSVSGMFIVIGLLFWLAHRSWRPLLKLLVMLGVILTGTLALGGLVFGELNVVSVGFAAMLLALAVDYGLVLYQESRIMPEAKARDLRRMLGPGILCAALTTAGAFLAAALSHLPGLVQMGLLVGAGILLAAGAMLCFFLPWVAGQHHGSHAASKRGAIPVSLQAATRQRLILSATLLVISVGVLALWGLPAVDRGTEALRPLHSPAYTALENLKHRFGRSAEPYWVLLTTPDDSGMIRYLQETDALLSKAVRERQIEGYTLPHGLWPDPTRQAANKALLNQGLPSSETLLRVAADAGFTEQALAFTKWILAGWNDAASQPGVWLPKSQLSQWTLQRLANRSGETPYALGLVHPRPGAPIPARFERALTDRGGTWLTSWDALGEELLQQMNRDLAVILPVVAVLLLTTLSLTFRRATEVLLGLAALILSLVMLQAAMQLAGWSWNLMNVIALPVLLGTGVDYGIHMQLALRRHHGNLSAVHRGVGRALLLCGVTTIAGFGSLSFSSNAGLASLGSLCASGMVFIVLTTVFLLPAWWTLCTASNTGPEPRFKPLSEARRVKKEERSTQNREQGDPNGSSSGTPQDPAEPERSSRLYRADVWKLGLGIVRWTPKPLLRILADLVTAAFWHLGRRRRATVIQNLRPLFPEQPARATEAAARLYRQFGRKLVDLWLYEAGRDIHLLFGELQGAEAFHAAVNSGKGVLLVTPHLGNWEFGGPVLAQHGIRLLALTLAEPDEPLTELRKQARARHGIETLVVQQDPFAFVEVIRRLNQGQIVALLIDRPPKNVATTVSLFGHPIDASVAPAELARASGCLILPVHLLRTPQGKYNAAVLEEVTYDRATLRDPEARRRLSQEILRVFGPSIRQHADQWFHFIPVWSEKGGVEVP